MENLANATDDIRMLGELIEGIEIAMLVSVAPGDALVSRPLTTLQSDFQGDLWFFVNATSGKIDDIAMHPQVNLSYADPEQHLYVSVAGTARVLDDRNKARELWHPGAETYFPGGPDDPELRLLKVEVESAQYWQKSGGLVSQTLRLMHAITGSGPEALDDNGELSIRP
jgi:general stress protein 26